ncbi:YdcH family protein [uncultured Pseudoteredinibacter sp.]|uniref:YdcH family protein n=1 Tax=uncultured Pseudoteredinibacter sp. TaxID=1641701 RepID=UPI002633F56C|nr:YdcH family protein [uncultured Pseudoteredinibacter sp.]
MNIEKHDLVHELPEYRDQIHDLKMNDRHFAKLFKEYHDLDHNVRGLEQNDSPTSDEHMEELKLKRLHLKDEMFAMLQKA